MPVVFSGFQLREDTSRELNDMKKCAYCGKEYPDEATVCPLDGEALAAGRRIVTGVWRGVFGYGSREKMPGLVPAAFTLKLKQGWLSRFTGTVTEDAPSGTPGTGTVDGYFGYPSIEFTKQMPAGYVINEDGTRTTLREYLIAGGHECKRELPAPPILYLGNFLDANRVQGTWVIQPFRIPLPDRSALTLPRLAGFWCAEFVTEDVKANPTGGPKEPLFDKARLSPAQLADVEGLPPCSLGKFNVADAERLVERLAHAGIQCRFSQDDSAMREMMPITAVTGGYGGTAALMEIFVNPDDEAAAQAIVSEDTPL
jgi:hypothetical protein